MITLPLNLLCPLLPFFSRLGLLGQAAKNDSFSAPSGSRKRIQEKEKHKKL
jgi:hypothetical protein